MSVRIILFGSLLLYRSLGASAMGCMGSYPAIHFHAPRKRERGATWSTHPRTNRHVPMDWHAHADSIHSLSLMGPTGTKHPRQYEESQATRELLSNGSLPFRLSYGKDGPGSTMHHKFVLVDGRTVMIGG